MQGHILVTFRVRAADGLYAACCDEPGVASCGDAVQDAFRAIEEATLLYLNVIDEGDELERVRRARDPLLAVA
jgi:predicted RNase H-like HicB family nuclease